MLTITVPMGPEMFDDDTEEFIRLPSESDVVLELEHSLLTLSKWEEEFEKPFLVEDEKSSEEILSYIRIMVQTPNVPPEVFSRLTQDNVDAINKYINAKRTATWFRETGNEKKNNQTITNELIYHWMFSYGIDIECQNWHLNRLFTLIRIFSAKNSNEKKKPMTAAERRALNAKRKADLGVTE